jgi:co-chaperonin GroES (HSP10)
MALTPLFNRVIIKPSAKKEKVSVSGIVTATQYDKTEELHGEIIAIGRDVEFVKVGDQVSFPSYGYDSVSANDGSGDFMSIREPEILAVITK